MVLMRGGTAFHNLHYGIEYAIEDAAVPTSHAATQLSGASMNVFLAGLESSRTSTFVRAAHMALPVLRALSTQDRPRSE